MTRLINLQYELYCIFQLVLLYLIIHFVPKTLKLSETKTKGKQGNAER
jgi:hypothetical protein